MLTKIMTSPSQIFKEKIYKKGAALFIFHFCCPTIPCENARGISIENKFQPGSFEATSRSNF